MISARASSLYALIVTSVCGVFSFGLPLEAHAAVVVSEVMYNPLGANVGHQWIEVANTGSDSLDLGAKNIRLFDSSGNHVIKAYGTGSTILAAGAVEVIAQNPLTFLSDNPNYTGGLLKSSFKFTTSGIVGIAQTDGTILDKVSFSSSLGAAGDGNSLQRLQNTGAVATFIAGAPTPGTYPLTPPAALILPAKPDSLKQISSTKSSTKQGKKTSKSVTSKTHEKGITAPADSANAASAGALPENGGLPDFSFSMPSFAIPYIPLLSSSWFAAFLALLGFSSFSILMIQRQYYL